MISVTKSLLALVEGYEYNDERLDDWSRQANINWREEFPHGLIFKPLNAFSYVLLKGAKEVGWLALFKYQINDNRDIPPSKIPAVRDIALDEDYRGLGLGRLMLTALIKHLGEVRSDPEGITSPEAARMWVAIGGVQGDPERHGDSSFYKALS